MPRLLNLSSSQEREWLKASANYTPPITPPTEYQSPSVEPQPEPFWDHAADQYLNHSGVSSSTEDLEYARMAELQNSNELTVLACDEQKEFAKVVEVLIEIGLQKYAEKFYQCGITTLGVLRCLDRVFVSSEKIGMNMGEQVRLLKWIEGKPIQENPWPTDQAMPSLLVQSAFAPNSKDRWSQPPTSRAVRPLPSLNPSNTDFQPGALEHINRVRTTATSAYPQPVWTKSHDREVNFGGKKRQEAKTRFCAYYPTIEHCKAGSLCHFAHRREEITSPLLSVAEEKMDTITDDFLLHRYKCYWCPVGIQHEWQACPYAHNFQDVRRDPSIGYGPKPCQYWDPKARSQNYSNRCPNGVACPYSHGAKEVRYHPAEFKTLVCWDHQHKTCPRGAICAFYHKKKHSRKPDTSSFDYDTPLTNAQLSLLQAGFETPPFTDDNQQQQGKGGKGNY